MILEAIKQMGDEMFGTGTSPIYDPTGKLITQAERDIVRGQYDDLTSGRLQADQDEFDAEFSAVKVRFDAGEVTEKALEKFHVRAKVLERRWLDARAAGPKLKNWAPQPSRRRHQAIADEARQLVRDASRMVTTISETQAYIKTLRAALASRKETAKANPRNSQAAHELRRAQSDLDFAQAELAEFEAKLVRLKLESEQAEERRLESELQLIESA